MWITKWSKNLNFILCGKKKKKNIEKKETCICINISLCPINKTEKKWTMFVEYFNAHIIIQPKQIESLLISNQVLWNIRKSTISMGAIIYSFNSSVSQIWSSVYIFFHICIKRTTSVTGRHSQTKVKHMGAAFEISFFHLILFPCVLDSNLLFFSILSSGLFSN